MSIMELSPLQEDDLERLGHFTMEEWDDIEVTQRFYLSRPNCFSVKAEEEGEILGIGTAVDSTGVGWIQDVGVASRWRRRGVGQALVSRLLEHLQIDKGCRTVLLGTSSMAQPLYEKLGFRVDTEYVTFVGDSEMPHERGFSRNIRACEPGDARDILALDLEICGEDRSAELGEQMGNAFVYASDGKVVGFYFPFVRKGMVEAVEREAGLELMRFKTLNTQSAVVPRENIHAIVFLIKNGYRQLDRETRMVLGAPFHWRPECIYGF